VRSTSPGTLVESLGPEGDAVMVGRWLSRPDGSVVQLPNSEAYSNTFWRGTTGYLVLLGGQLLQITP